MDQLTEIANGLQISNYLAASIFTLVVYDYLLNIGDEITFIWEKRRHDAYGLGTIIYTLARYSPVFGMPLTLLAQLPDAFDIETCRWLFYGTAAVQAFQVTISQVLFMIRNYALWQSRKRLLVVIVLFFIGLAIVTAFLVLSLPSTTFAPSPVPRIAGCFKTGVPPIFSGIFIVILVSEAGLLASTVTYLLKYTPQERPKLLQSLIEEGIVYSVWMLSFSTANVFVIYLAQEDYSDLITTYQCVFHTILASRLHLHLKRYNDSILHSGHGTAQVSDLVFRAGTATEVTV